MELELEADKEYYFLLDTMNQGQTYLLSMHTKELVMFNLDGAPFTEWQRKEKK